MGKNILHCTQPPFGKVTEKPQVNSKLPLAPAAKGNFVSLRLFSLLLLFVVSSQSGFAQSIYKPLPEDTNSIIYPFAFRYNNQQIEQTEVRYGVFAAVSTEMLDEMMLVYDVYEKIPAAVRLVPNGSNMPVWNFRYWPDQELFTWVEINNNNTAKPVMAYVCNRKLEIIDTFGISNPHELYVMPNNLGYAYIGSREVAGIMYPTFVWMAPNQSTNVYWDSSDPTWGFSSSSFPQSTCGYTTLDTMDNGFVDYFHPNSIAAVQTSPTSVKIGIYSRNTDTEFEVSVSFNGTKWVTDNAIVISKNNHLGHQSDDSVWVNTAHDLQYLYHNQDTIIKSLWDNGGCRARPNTGYKIFSQVGGDSVRTIRKGLYEVLGQSTAMGNGGIMLRNRYASSLAEIENALSFGNIGSANFNLSNDNGLPKLGVWDKNNNMVFEVEQDYSFFTYRFYPYFDNQLEFDDLRPYLNISYSQDSSYVTLSVDRTQYSDVMWADGVVNVWSRTLTLQEFRTKELVAFVTNNPDWFWFSSHRYNNGTNYVGVDEVELLSNSFKVYPNPIKSGYTLNLNAKVNATLTDLAGKSISNCTDCDAMLIPDTTAPGIYLLNVVSGQTVSVSKVLVY